MWGAIDPFSWILEWKRGDIKYNMEHTNRLACCNFLHVFWFLYGYHWSFIGIFTLVRWSCIYGSAFCSRNLSILPTPTICVQVYHSAWRELCEGMTMAKSLDEVIEVHEAYILSIQRQCFVVPDKLVIYCLSIWVFVFSLYPVLTGLCINYNVAKLK